MDSTETEHPEGVNLKNAMPPRARRTYGRRNASDELQTRNELSTDKPSISMTLFSHSKEPSDDLIQEALSHNIAGHYADWRERMKQFDFDGEDENNTAVASSASLAQERPARETSNIMDVSKADDSFSSEYNDSSTLFSTAPPKSSSQSLPPSPESAKNTQRTAKKAADSDSDEEHLASGRQEPGDASSNLFPLLTSNRHPSFSPPSSDAENDAFRPSRNVPRKIVDSESDDNDGNASSLTSSKGGSGSKNLRTKKIKKLSKKEEKESKKAHARLIADQSVQFTKKGNTRISVLDFFRVLNRDDGSKKILSSEQSDPIILFTSPARDGIGASAVNLANADTHVAAELGDGSDEELSNNSTIAKQLQQEDAAKRRRNELLQIKRRAAARSKNPTPQGDSESDDLEIVSNDKKGKHQQGGNLEKKLAPIAGFSIKKAGLSELHPSSQDLRAAAKPAFGRSRSGKGEMSVDNKALQEIMLEKAAKQVQKITSEKESEWVRRGGKLKERVGLKDITEENVASKLAATILETKGDALEHPDEYQQSESSDEDWAPTHEDGGESDDGCNDGIQMGQETGIQSDADDSDGEEEGAPVFHPNRTKKVAKRTVASESEEELGSEHVPKGRVLVPDTSFVDNSEDSEYQRQQALLHRGSRSSFEGSLPDDEDKENNENLMFDNGEDKENVAIPLHLPAQSGSISRRSPSPDVSDDFSDKENGPIRQRLFTSEPPAMSISIGTSGPLNVASPMTLQPAFDQGPSRFSQFFDDDEGFEEPAGGDENSRPMHSSSPELRPVVPRGVLSQAFSQGEPSFFDRIKRPAFGQESTLTLDSTLQPALDVTTQVKRKAGAIFEKEQMLVLEGTTQKPKSRPELYITESGLLTQTKPDVSTPLIYRTWSPTQHPKVGQSSQMPLQPRATQRIPLQPLTLSPESEKPSRLSKGIRPASKKPANVFESMMEKERQRHSKKALKSEFVAGEAEESDEDEMFGFGAKRTEEDEESGDEDPNAVVPNLVDDAHMDLDTLAEDKVLEKVKEHQEQDEAALEKYHKDAIEGKYRSKKRTGVGLDLSESDDSDEENAMRRKKMNKKRKVDNDTLEDLNKDENGRSFYKAYQADIHTNEDDDFSHLNQDEMAEEPEDEPEEKTISTTEIYRKLREERKFAEDSELLDIDNAEWAVPEEDDDDLDHKVQEIAIHRVGAPRQRLNELDDPEARRKATYWNDLKPWQKEQSNRYVGTGGARAAAVTGHVPKAATSSSTSSASSLIASKLKGDGTQHQDHQKERRKVKKAASVLAQIKHGHFEG